MTAHGAAQALLPGPQTTPAAASTDASRYANMLLHDAGKPLGFVCV
jgi:enhancing lycopene biosynthesis protein 2